MLPDLILVDGQVIAGEHKKTICQHGSSLMEEWDEQVRGVVSESNGLEEYVERASGGCWYVVGHWDTLSFTHLQYLPPVHQKVV